MAKKEAAQGGREVFEVIDSVAYFLGTPVSKLVDVMDWLLSALPNRQSENNEAYR
jgi:hypothetical protein